MCTISHRKALPIAVLTVIGLLQPAGRASDDTHSCPDFGTHRAVLDEGIKQLRKVSPQGDTLYENSAGASFYLDPSLAADHVRSGQLFGRSYLLDLSKVNEKSLKELEANKTGGDEVILGTLSTLARLHVLVGADDWSFEKLLGIKPDVYPVSELIRLNYSMMLQLPIIDISQQGSAPDFLRLATDRTRADEWRIAKEFYGQAVSIRRKSPANHMFAKDLLNLACLEELTGNTKLAWSQYLEAFAESPEQSNSSDDPGTAAKCLIACAARHSMWSELRELEPSFISKDKAALTNLIETYFTCQRSSDAQRLFRELVAIRPVPPTSLPFARLCKLIDGADDSQKENIQACLTQWIGNGTYAASVLEIASCLEQRHWVGVAEAVYVAGYKQESSLTRGFAWANFYVRSKQLQASVQVYDKLIDKASKPAYENAESYATAVRDLADIERQLEHANLLVYNDAISRTKSLQSTLTARKSKLECLQLAEKLTNTGARLETAGEFGEAAKVYQSALDIRVKNLGANDILVANTLLDLARSTGEKNGLQSASSYYERAIAIYRTNIRDHGAELRAALEGYGSLLERSKQHVAAERVYAEARQIRL